MAIGFNIQFRINEKTESRVIRLTDTTTGFALTKGIFSIVHPDGYTILHTDFNNPDITTIGGYYDFQASTDVYNNVLTGQYVITYVGQTAALATDTIVRTIDFNWIKPTKSIVNLSDTMIPEVKFQDSTVYTSSGSFTGVLTSRTFNVLMPTTSAVSGTTVTAASNIIDAVVSTNYYEGVYTPKSDIVATYTHISLSTSLTVVYTALLEKQFDVKKAPTRQELITRINLFRTQVDAYKEANDTQFETLSEIYDILIALYMHLIERAQSGTLDGSQDILMEIINILDKYTPYFYQYGPISAFYFVPYGTGTVTSVGLTAPSAFTVTNSPVTTSGSLTFTGAGNALQYVDGTGALQTFPTVLPANRMVTTGRNATGSTLYKGTIVYISGSTGNRPNFVKAQASGESTSAGTFGVIFADIANNADGDAVTIGTIDTLDTRSIAAHPFTTDTLNDGDTIYLSPTTAGYVTNVKPSAPNHLVYVGKVVRTTPQDGTIVYRIQNGYELDEIHDVQVGSYVNKDILYRDTTLNLWKNASIPTVLGYTPYNAANPNSYIALTGLSSTATGLTYTNTTGVFSLTTGYAIPTTIKQSNWDDAYTWVAAFPTQTGNSGKFLTTNGSSLSWATVTSGVSSFNTRTGAITLTSSDVTTALTFTPYNSTNPSNYIALTALSSTATGLTYTNTTGVFSLTTGYAIPTTASQTNWDTAYTNRITSLTTTGSSGSATLITNTLNIPTYTLAGLGGQASSTNLTSLSGLTYASASFVKMTAAGTFSLDTNTYYLASNPSGYTSNIGTVTSVAALTLGTTGTDLSSTVANGTTAAVITLNVPTASAANRGALSSTDWTTFNNKQGAITLTVTGNSGAATFITNTLNIPTYTLAGLGGQASSTNLTSLSGLTFASTSFVKMTAAGTFALDTTTYYAASNPSGYTSNTGTVTSVAALTLGTTGTDLSSTVATGTTTAVITLNVPNASATNRGALTSADWTTFNGKQGALTLTTTGSSGAATLVGNTLNIPQYTGGGGGTVLSVSVTTANGISGTVANATSTPAITLTLGAITPTTVNGLTLTSAATGFTIAGGTTSKTLTVSNTLTLAGTDTSTLNIGGGGTLGSAAFTASTAYQASSTNLTSLAGLTFASTSFVKMTAAGTFALDTTAYTANLGTVTSVAALTLGTTGTDLSSTVATGTTTPVITLNVPNASAANRGALTSTDWSTFNNKQGAITLTTTGSSGSATFTTNTLNIPTYTLAGLGGQASSTNLTSLSGLTFASTSFVKMTAAGTFALDTNTYYLASNPSGYTNNTGTVTSVAALTLGTTGTDLSSTVATGTTTPVITLNVPNASATNRGALTSADWTTFNSKQGALTLTTTGTSGAATLIGNTLNIPNYATGGGSGTVTTVSVVSANGFAGTVATATSTPAITISTTITGLLKGNGTAISAATPGTDYQAPITLTTTGTSGAATFVGNTLNIPQYTGGGGGGSVNRTTYNFTATAAQTTFTISGGYTAGYIDVYVNGVRLTAADYTASNGTTVVMGAGLLVGDIVDVVVYAVGTGGSSAYTVTSQTANYTATATTGTLIVKGDTTGGTFTITLPTAVSNTATIIVKKVAGSAGLVIDGAGTETIDGGLTATLNKVYESVTLISDNANWQIV